MFLLIFLSMCLDNHSTPPFLLKRYAYIGSQVISISTFVQVYACFFPFYTTMIPN